MTIKRYTDRSRIETHQRCNRRRFLEYEESGTGIQPAKKNIHLAVGGAVHRGLEVLVRDGQGLVTEYGSVAAVPLLAWSMLEENAVGAALADFAQFSGRLEGDDLPSNVQAIAPDAFSAQMAAQAIELGVDPSAFAGPSQAERQSRAEAYLFAELSALVEALVRAYARRRLRPLVEEFEVLEVEREGEWKLAEWGLGTICEDCSLLMRGRRTKDVRCPDCGGTSIALHDDNHVELWFLSRPDALLRHRQTNELQILSFKTTGGWDVRKARDVQHDMQGLSEGVEIERRYSRWWDDLQTMGLIGNAEGQTPEQRHKSYDAWAWGKESPTPAVFDYLRSQPAAPRVSAIRYEFLLKGERWKDKDLSAQLGVEARIQKSHLIYQYVATSTPKTGKNTESFRVGDVCWAWEFTRPEDQQSSKLYAGNWRPRAVWEAGSIREWIDKLDRSELLMSGEDSTVGMEPRALGWRSDAQAMGVTAVHPLDSVFIPPQTVYRQDDQLRDWAEQTAEQEERAAEAAMLVAGAKDAGEKRSLLNQLFPQHRGACSYPTECPFARDRVSVCWGGAEIQADPLTIGGGEYVRREPNHPQERVVDADSGISKL